MGRKLMVVFGEPMRKENNHYLYSCTRDILKEKGRNISVDVQGMEKKPSQLRKYGKLGWVYIQILQYKNALQAVRRTAPGDIILSQDFGTGRLCSYIAMKKHTERKVLAMNCLQRRGGGFCEG